MMGRAAAPRVLGELIEDRVKRNGDKISFRFSNRCAHAFQNLGVWKGDKLSTTLPNRPEHSYVVELLPRIFFLAVNTTEHPIY
jgi:hypothetical protein